MSASELQLGRHDIGSYQNMSWAYVRTYMTWNSSFCTNILKYTIMLQLTLQTFVCIDHFPSRGHSLPLWLVITWTLPCKGRADPFPRSLVVSRGNRLDGRWEGVGLLTRWISYRECKEMPRTFTSHQDFWHCQNSAVQKKKDNASLRHFDSLEFLWVRMEYSRISAGSVFRSHELPPISHFLLKRSHWVRSSLVKVLTRTNGWFVGCCR